MREAGAVYAYRVNRSGSITGAAAEMTATRRTSRRLRDLARSHFGSARHRRSRENSSATGRNGGQGDDSVDAGAVYAFR